MRECFEREIALDESTGSWSVVSMCHDECTTHEPDHYEPLYLGGGVYSERASDLLCMLGLYLPSLDYDGGSDDAGPPGPAGQLKDSCTQACFPSWR